ncbi:MAG: capsule assembly Wzi family protein, partial [Duncaniella sp.]|nr:capsule assembly Wzi family protein [Duncaniella sp.]
DMYNHYNYHITKKAFFNYKRLYFRTRPTERFSVTVGLQAVAKFGGTAYYYYKGELSRIMKFSSGIGTFLKMLLPYEDGGEGFYTGNHLGSWDLRARYTLNDGKQLFAYFSFPWEDGSGIGKLNGWDGLWGLEYKASETSFINGAVIEYLDFTNQSGPLHFNPGDFEGSTIPDHVSGSDDYYNNLGHNSYAYYGMSMGTPAVMAPIYNTDGYPAYKANAMRGFHVGVEGTVFPGLDYRLKGGYRKGWGSGYVLMPKPMHLAAVMLEANWRPAGIKGLTVNGRVELDRGNMPGNAFGAVVTLRYNGTLNFK